MAYNNPLLNAHLDNPFLTPNPFLAPAIKAAKDQSQPGQSVIEPPPEDESLLSQIASGPLSALGWIGETLDKSFGGRTVRGLLGGQGLSSFSHLIPFSDTLGLTDKGLLGNNLLADKHETPTGQKLLEKAGILDENSEGVLPFVAGLGVDILTDPGTYMTGPLRAAMTNTGKVVKKAGLLPTVTRGAGGVLESAGPRELLMTKRFADVAKDLAPDAQKALQTAAEKAGTTVEELLSKNEQLGTLGRFAGWNFGKGATAQKVARGIDTVGEAIKYSPPGRALGSLFDYVRRGVGTKAGQVAQEAADEGIKAEQLAGRQAISEAAQNVARHMQVNEGKLPGLSDDISNYFEFGEHPNYKMPESIAPIQKDLDAMAEAYRGEKGIAFRETAAGSPTKMLDDEYRSYLPQQLGEHAYEGQSAGRQAFQTGNRFQEERLGMTRDIPRGRVGVNQLLTDPELWPMADTAVAQGYRDAKKISTQTTMQMRKALMEHGVSPEEAATMSTPDVIDRLKSLGIEDLPLDNRGLVEPLAEAIRTRHYGAGVVNPAQETGMWKGMEHYNQMKDAVKEFSSQREALKQWLDEASKPMGTQMGKVQLDPTRVQELMDSGLSRQDAFAKASSEAGPVKFVNQEASPAIESIKEYLGSKLPPDAPPTAVLAEANKRMDWLNKTIARGETVVGRLEDIIQKSNQWADYMTTVPAESAIRKQGWFTRHPVEDIMSRLDAGGRTVGMMNALTDFAAKNAVQATGQVPLDPSQYVPLHEVLSDKNLPVKLGGGTLDGDLGAVTRQANKQMQRAEATAAKAQDVLEKWDELHQPKVTKAAQAAADAAGEVPEGVVKLSSEAKSVLRKLGLSKEAIAEITLEDARTAIQGAAERAGKYTVREFLDPLLQAKLPDVPGDVSNALYNATATRPTDALLKVAEKAGMSPEDARHLYIPKEIAEDVTRFVRTFQSPEAVGKLTELYDKFTKTFKSLTTLPWPGFHFRNKLTGIASDLIAGVKAADIPWSHSEAYGILTGKAVDGIEKLPIFRGMNLTAEQATDLIRRKLFEHNLGSDLVNHSDLLDAATKTGAQTAGQRMPAMFPGMIPEGASDVWQAIKPDVLTGAKTEPGWLASKLPDSIANKLPHPVAAGGAATELVEKTNRIATFLGLLKDGWSEAAAAAKSKLVHGEYSRLTDFERGFMKRAIPFYSFNRLVLPQFIDSLMERPGGFVGQVIRAENNRRQQGGFTPDYISSGLAIPIGGEENGIQKYATESGVVPIENLNDLIKGGKNPLEVATNTGQALLGQLNPLIKGPLELATNRQFYSGRELTDLQPRTGSILTDQLVLNSPLTRFISTGSKMLDPRKGIIEKGVNLLTGAKTTDVDVNRARDRAAQEQITESLRGEGVGRVMPMMYVPAEQKALLTPEQQRMYALFQGIERRARERAKIRQAQSPQTQAQ